MIAESSRLHGPVVPLVSFRHLYWPYAFEKEKRVLTLAGQGCLGQMTAPAYGNESSAARQLGNPLRNTRAPYRADRIFKISTHDCRLAVADRSLIDHLVGRNLRPSGAIDGRRIRRPWLPR
jgi:hypothetical protein